MGNLGHSKETWSDCECRESNGAPTVSLELPAIKGTWSQLRWWECDCQSGSWMAGEGSFLNTEQSGLWKESLPWQGGWN